ERVVDLVTALDADQRADAVRLVHADDVRRRVCHGQVRRIARAQRLDQIDLLERRLHRLRALHVYRDPHRPELRPDAADAQAGNVGHEWHAIGRGRQRGGGGGQIDLRQITPEARADLPGQIVVAVDERPQRFAL